MENSTEMIAASSPSEALDASNADSHFSVLLFDLSQQLQTDIANLMKITSEINQTTGEISEEIEKCKQSEGSKSMMLDVEKERFQKAALVVLEMLRHS